jgi:hypothetical protein
MKMTSSDEKKCGINVRVGRKKVYRSTLNDIADTLRVPREDIETVLESWTHEQVVANLEQYPAEVLDSLASERRFLDFKKS